MEQRLVEFVDATEGHLKLIYNWRNQSFIREVMYDSEPLKWDNHVDWFRSVINDDRKYVKILYYNDIPYGLANFQMTDALASIGEWGFYIGEREAPKGMGKLLAYCMLNFLFEDVKVKKVCAEVISFNDTSLKFHQKVGFKLEGILRQHFSKNGEYYNIHVFGLLQDEWNGNKITLEKELFDE